MIIFDKSAARNPNTAPSKLNKLALGGNPEILKSVAQNPSALPSTLEQLARNPNADVRSAVASNPGAPTAVLDQILEARSVTESEALSAASNEATSAKALTRLAKSKSPAVVRAVAGNRATPTTVRIQLFNDNPGLRDVLIGTGSAEDVADRVALAKNGSTTELQFLVYDSSPEVRRAAASAPYVSRDSLEVLVQDAALAVANVALARQSKDARLLSSMAETDDDLVLTHLFRNTSTPPDVKSAVARRLLAVADRETAGAIARDASMPVDVLEELANHASSLVRNLVARNPSTPSRVVCSFANDEDAAIRAFAAQASLLPLEAMVRLAGDTDPKVRAAIAGNASIPPELLTRLAADEDPDVQAQVARHEQAPAVALQRIVESASVNLWTWSSQGDPLFEAARNRRTPPQAFRDLESRRKKEMDAARHTWTSLSKRQDLAPFEESWNRVQVEIASNPSTPADLLLDITRDELNEQKLNEKNRYHPHDPAKRERLIRAILANTSCPLEALELLKDGCWVAARTREESYREDGRTFSDRVHDYDRTRAAKRDAIHEVRSMLSRIAWNAEMGDVDHLAFAESETTDPEILAELALNPDAIVRSAVAANRSTPPRAFSRLASDPVVAVRLAAAKTSHADESSEMYWAPQEPPVYEDGFLALARDTDADVRAALVANDAVFWGMLSPEVRERMVFDSDPRVRAALLRSFDITRQLEAELTMAALEHLIDTGNSEVWQALAARFDMPSQIVDRLVDTSDSKALAVIADRYEVETGILARLASGDDPAVLARVVAHADDPQVTRVLARNPRVLPDDLAKVARLTRDSQTLKLIVLNPSLPESVLVEFATGDDTPRLRAAALSGRPAVLEAVSANAGAPGDVLEYLAVTGGPAVREALLVNEGTPGALLVRLIKERSDGWILSGSQEVPRIGEISFDDLEDEYQSWQDFDT